MKRLALILAVLMSISISAQRIITKKFELPNKREKLLKIFLPKGIENDSIHKYPLTIVLNDDYLFDMVVGNAKIFADADLAPRQLVVGIPTNRNENMDISIVEESQGLTRNSTALYNFIKDDLIKYMRAKWKASPFKTIVADRKAANYAMYFIDEREPVFNSYLILDPTFTQEANKKIESYNLAKLGDIDNTFYLYISTSPYITEEEQIAQKELETMLTSFDVKNFKVLFDKSENALNGVTNVCEGIPKGFSFCFNDYRCITKKEYKEKIAELPPLDAIKYLEQKYLDINFLYGTNIKIRKKDFYAVENKVIDEEDGDHLSILGDLALVTYPKSPLGDFYMGKFYESGKDYPMALDYYKAGFGKIDPADPKIDDYYKNIDRVQNIIGKQPKKEPVADEEEEQTDDQYDDEEEDEEDEEDEEE